MSIHQTKDGRWFAAYRLKDSKDVKRKYFGRGQEGRLAAQRWEADFLTKRDQCPAPMVETSTITFFELAQKYLTARPLAESTYRSLVYSLNLRVLPLWGNLPVAKLTMANLNEVDESLVAAGCSLATRNRYGAYCKAICQWGVNNDLISENPFLKFRPDIKRENKAPDLITEDELKAIFKSAAPHLQWAIEVMINTGVRPGKTELLALKMQDIDFEKNGIWLRRQKTHEKKASLLPLRPEFMDRLHDLADSEPSRQFLVEYKGNPMGSLKTAWGHALKRAGITRRLRLYDLRHWYASTLLSGGADIKAASELMGHSSPALTLKTYYHLVENQKRQALNHLTIPSLDYSQKDTADKHRGKHTPPKNG